MFNHTTLLPFDSRAIDVLPLTLHNQIGVRYVKDYRLDIYVNVSMQKLCEKQGKHFTTKTTEDKPPDQKATPRMREGRAINRTSRCDARLDDQF